MTSYPTCQGCTHSKARCETKEAIRSRIKGLNVTTIKWICDARTPIFNPGDAVWATTWDGMPDENGSWEWTFDDFPAVVINQFGTKAVVYIAIGIAGRKSGSKFQTSNNGFCKIKLSCIKR